MDGLNWAGGRKAGLLWRGWAGLELVRYVCWVCGGFVGSVGLCGRGLCLVWLVGWLVDGWVM